MVGVEPAVVGMAEAIEFADVDHAGEHGARFRSFKGRGCNLEGRSLKRWLIFITFSRRRPRVR